MNLLYLIGSLAGVLLIVGVNVLLLGRVPARLGGLKSAEARLAQDVPGFSAGDAALSADGITALMVNTQDGAPWLVHAKGAGMITRNLKCDGLRAATRDGASLTLTLGDFTLPRVRLALADEASAREWAARLGWAS